MSSQSAGVGSALPDQTGQSGMFLSTDGVTPFWTAGGGSGVTAFGAFGSTPNANGGSVAGTTATLQPADGTHPGGVSTGAQTFAGDKTFSGNVISDTSLTYALTGTPTVVLTDVGIVYGMWLYPGANAPSTSNWAICSTNNSDTNIQGPTVLNFYINGTKDIIHTAGELDLSAGATVNTYLKLGYTDLTGSPGTSGTANTSTGRFILSAGNSTFTVTCSACHTGSVVLAQAETALGTALGWYVDTVTTNSFKVHTLANAPSGGIQFSFLVLN